jgi:3',5'-nucleoside bisphosphate phosphatase
VRSSNASGAAESRLARRVIARPPDAVVIDLHLHTTASDGKLAPAALVALAASAGLTIIGVTDHDTIGGLAEARGAAQGRGLRLVDGIEITVVEEGRDVHVLGYFFDPSSDDLARFLQRQRADRIDRVREIGARLNALHYPIDVDAILTSASIERGRSVGRPLLADALVTAGHAVDRKDAFDRLLGANGPAFVPRCGPTLARACEVIASAGGISSLAHPGLLGLDERLPRFAESGLAALEVRHRDHPPDVESHYRERAQALGLAVSGGSDFHGEEMAVAAAQAAGLGRITLGPEDFAALEARASA